MNIPRRTGQQPDSLTQVRINEPNVHVDILTTATRRDVVTRYRNGAKIRTISESLNIPDSITYYILEREGVAPTRTKLASRLAADDATTVQLYEHISMHEEWIGRLLAGTTPDLPVSDDLPSEKVLAAPPAKTTSNETFVQGVDSGEWVSDLRAAAALALEKLVALDLMTQVVEHRTSTTRYSTFRARSQPFAAVLFARCVLQG